MSYSIAIRRPDRRPVVPNFSSGPCTKRPGWSLEGLNAAALGRAHRSVDGSDKLSEVIDRSRSILGIPKDYLIGIVPGSDTGAVEMALWSLLGLRGVDVLAWESFGFRWSADIIHELCIPDVRVFEADYGTIPDLEDRDIGRDLVFTWNGTSSGVRVPDGDWISPDREGLVICDATSAVFAMPIPWRKLDVVTWSWQKALGGEAAHGMIALSPKAVGRLESFVPDRPIPRLFRLVDNGCLNLGIFRGLAINTPSLLCVEDAIDALKWAESIGGLDALVARAETNLAVVSKWVEQTGWVEFLAQDEGIRSSTSICLSIIAPWFSALGQVEQDNFMSCYVKVLADEAVAYDIINHRDAPPGLRVWGGPTVNASDLVALMPWLDWAFENARKKYTG